MGHDHALATLRCQRLGDRPSTRRPRRGLDRRGPTAVATNEAAIVGRSGRRRIGYSEPLPRWPLSRRPLISTMQASTAASRVWNFILPITG
jgi:hypothetical protein